MRAGGLLVIAAALVLTAPVDVRPNRSRSGSRTATRSRSGGSATGSTASTLRNCIRTAPTPAARPGPAAHGRGPNSAASLEPTRSSAAPSRPIATAATSRSATPAAAISPRRWCGRASPPPSTRRGSTNPYETAQADARADKRGIWAGRFETPGEWRRANPRDDDGAPSPSPARATGLPRRARNSGRPCRTG